MRQRVGLFVDIPERNPTRAHRREQLVALPVDPAITDRTARVVPDGQVVGGHSVLMRLR